MSASAARPVIVLLNGPGSSGKTTLAKALQGMHPLLHVQMDRFLEMLPEAMQDHPETFAYMSGPGGVEVRIGPAGARLMAGFRGAVTALAAAGNDLIVDDVWLDGEPVAYAALPGRVLRVGLFVPLDVLARRETARGDRMVGLARAQHRRCHDGVAYDLKLDGTEAADANARRVLDAVGRLLKS
jgi:chloramphenicol 3-O phosphotransferase